MRDLFSWIGAKQYQWIHESAANSKSVSTGTDMILILLLTFILINHSNGASRSHSISKILCIILDNIFTADIREYSGYCNFALVLEMLWIVAPRVLLSKIPIQNPPFSKTNEVICGF